MINIKEPHASAIFFQNGDMLYVSEIKVKDIETRKNSISENGDNGTCWRQEDGTTEPIRKEVSRGVKEKTQKKEKSREKR